MSNKESFRRDLLAWLDNSEKGEMMLYCTALEARASLRDHTITDSKMKTALDDLIKILEGFFEIRRYETSSTLRWKE